MVYIVFEKISWGRSVPTLVNKFAVTGDFNQNERPLMDLAMQPLVEQLHSPIMRKLEKKKVYSSFKDKTSGVDLADMK